MTIEPGSSQPAMGHEPRPQPYPVAPPDTSKPFPAPSASGASSQDAPPQLAPMRTVRPLGVAVMVMLAVWAVTAVGSVIISLVRVSMITEELEIPGSVGVDALTLNDNLYATSGVAWLVTYLAAAVVFLMWLFRARNNAEAASTLQHRRSKVWLVLGWVVPVVSLWFPKQVVDDIWRSSDPSTPASATDLDGIRKPGLVYGWWTLWLISGWLGYVFLRVSLDVETLEDIRTAAIIDVLTTPIDLAAALLVALVVTRISGFQEARRSGLEISLPPAPPSPTTS